MFSEVRLLILENVFLNDFVCRGKSFFMYVHVACTFGSYAMMFHVQ